MRYIQIKEFNGKIIESDLRKISNSRKGNHKSEDKTVSVPRLITLVLFNEKSKNIKPKATSKLRKTFVRCVSQVIFFY